MMLRSSRFGRCRVARNRSANRPKVNKREPQWALSRTGTVMNNRVLAQTLPFLFAATLGCGGRATIGTSGDDPDGTPSKDDQEPVDRFKPVDTRDTSVGAGPTSTTGAVGAIGTTGNYGNSGGTGATSSTGYTGST